jgi:hypothetical protein
MKNTNSFPILSQLAQTTLSSGRRLATRARRISKDIAASKRSIASYRSKLEFHRERISKLQKEADEIIKFTAPKEVISLRKEPVLVDLESEPETSLPLNGDLVWSQEDQEFLNSLMKTPEYTPGVDILCYETAWDYPELFPDLTSVLNGFGENPEWENLDMLMTDSQMPILKTLEQNGGMDTC